jgi:nitrite reductase/ring-hydroxylating ferredoxin subunit
MERSVVNRGEFFKEMKKGFMNTLKTLYEPLIDDDLEVLEKTTDRLLGIQWAFVCRPDYPFEKLNEFYIDGKPIFIVQNSGNMRAISGICPSCSNLLNLSVLLLTCKCFNCGKEYNFHTETGDLILWEHPLIKKNDGYYAGLNKKSLFNKMNKD